MFRIEKSGCPRSTAHQNFGKKNKLDPAAVKKVFRVKGLGFSEVQNWCF
jgi:hypothetical protein